MSRFWIFLHYLCLLMYSPPQFLFNAQYTGPWQNQKTAAKKMHSKRKAGIAGK